ncbi:hypothetical protein D3C78_1688960 [compost metagenome]
MAVVDPNQAVEGIVLIVTRQGVGHSAARRHQGLREQEPGGTPPLCQGKAGLALAHPFTSLLVMGKLQGLFATHGELGQPPLLPIQT